MKNMLKRFMKDERGTELAEWAIMAALLIVVAVATIAAIGGKISNVFDTLDSKLDAEGVGAGD